MSSDWWHLFNPSYVHTKKVEPLNTEPTEN